MPKLAQGHIKSLRIPLPPRERQSEVISRAKEATKPIAAAIDRVAREVALLQEFRARLVADVVAGQVDVRGVAASLQEVDLTASWGDPASVEDDDKTDFDDVIEANED